MEQHPRCCPVHLGFTWAQSSHTLQDLDRRETAIRRWRSNLLWRAFAAWREFVVDERGQSARSSGSPASKRKPAHAPAEIEENPQQSDQRPQRLPAKHSGAASASSAAVTSLNLAKCAALAQAPLRLQKRVSASGPAHAARIDRVPARSHTHSLGWTCNAVPRALCPPPSPSFAPNFCATNGQPFRNGQAGMTGLRNLGQTCYMNSVLQVPCCCLAFLAPLPREPVSPPDPDGWVWQALAHIDVYRLLLSALARNNLLFPELLGVASELVHLPSVGSLESGHGAPLHTLIHHVCLCLFRLPWLCLDPGCEPRCPAPAEHPGMLRKP